MNRRGFIGTILAAAVAPAIVRADALMRIVPREVILLDGLQEFRLTQGVARYGQQVTMSTGDFTMEAWYWLDQPSHFAKCRSNGVDTYYRDGVVIPMSEFRGPIIG